MEIVRKSEYLNYIVLKDVIELKQDCHSLSDAHDYYNLIKASCKENSRYMIKRQQLKHMPLTWDEKAYQKTYFCYAVCFTYKRKRKEGIFYCNNRAKIIRLAKMLTGSRDELYSIVDRRTGKETYILTKLQAKSNRKIFVN